MPSELSLIIYLFSATIAAGSAYAFLMSVLQRTPAITWLKGETLLLTIASLTGVTMTYTTISLSSIWLLLFLTNILTFLLGAILFFMSKQATAPEANLKTIKSLGIIAFSVAVFQVLLLFAALTKLSF